MPLPSKLCLPFGAFSQDLGKGQDVALSVGGKWAPARKRMCEHVPCGRYPKKIQLNSKGPHEFRDMLDRTVHGTLGEKTFGCLPSESEFQHAGFHTSPYISLSKLYFLLSNKQAFSAF